MDVNSPRLVLGVKDHSSGTSPVAPLVSGDIKLMKISEKYLAEFFERLSSAF